MYDEKRVVALIVGGGSGSRFGGETAKQFLNVGGEMMILAAARPFFEHAAVDALVFAVPEDSLGWFRAEVENAFGASRAKSVVVVAGGRTRAESVLGGLDAAEVFEPSIVLIHDAARPFVTESVIGRVLAAAAECGAAVPCVSVTDTVYETHVTTDDTGLWLASVPERSRLAAGQTPQGFDFDLIRRAHAEALNSGLAVTDDGSPVSAVGHAVRIVDGDVTNVKITTRADLPERSFGFDVGDGVCRVGMGFDAHRFASPDAGRKLILGGVVIDFDKGLDGHSDADVLTHALMDAILGALKLGDIGTLFPDTDERYRGISSMKLLSFVMKLVNERHYSIKNADMTIVAERPRIAPVRDSIERSLAAALGVDAGDVSVKATTTERLGFTGREEGIAAEAVVLLRRSDL